MNVLGERKRAITREGVSLLSPHDAVCGEGTPFRRAWGSYPRRYWLEVTPAQNLGRQAESPGREMPPAIQC